MFVELMDEFVYIAHSVASASVGGVGSLEELSHGRKLRGIELKQQGEGEVHAVKQITWQQIVLLTIIVFSSVMWVSHSRAPPGVAARLIAEIDRQKVI
jgi:hypothetical protein